MKKKILFITSDFNNKGGAILATKRLIELLKKDFKLIILKSNNKKKFFFIKNLISKIIKKFFLKEFYTNSLNIFSNVSVKNIDYDLVHINWIGNDTISLFEIEKIKKPIIWTMQDMWPMNSTSHFEEKRYDFKREYKNNFLKNLIYSVKKRIYYKKKIIFVANSNWLKRESLKSKLSKNQKIEVIYNPIENNFWKNQKKTTAREKLNLSLDKKIILFGTNGGFVNPRKGGDILLNSLKYLKEVNNLEFVILGVDHNYTETISNFKFYFRKFTHNKFAQRLYHSSCDLMVMPSRAESLPQFLIETALCGNAAICFNIGGLNEIVKHKKNGYLAKPFSEKDFSDGIRYCLSHNLRTDTTMRKLIVNKFNKQKILSDYKKVYELALNHK